MSWSLEQSSPLSSQRPQLRKMHRQCLFVRSKGDCKALYFLRRVVQQWTQDVQLGDKHPGSSKEYLLFQVLEPLHVVARVFPDLSTRCSATWATRWHGCSFRTLSWRNDSLGLEFGCLQSARRLLGSWVKQAVSVSWVVLWGFGPPLWKFEFHSPFRTTCVNSCPLFQL